MILFEVIYDHFNGLCRLIKGGFLLLLTSILYEKTLVLLRDILVR
ncbi:hypothetical protein CLV62_103126 [Dysgonomonas alginatilytica]|uniref:Uncharacterized protein n=1 Tax=Dysgonomonas alginatilytica TaxID=1605892 RepID=A0A2V3PRN3_9BACT|nr:hypothetical protein CLV62_103126 [Dysgonomonas alginatilytica]